MVKRLTSEPAEIFGLDVGSLEIGAQADMVLINPDALDSWQPDQTRKLEYREIFGHEQMVNRPEGIVDSVYINGVVAWKDGAAQAALGQQTLGEHCERHLASPGTRAPFKPLTAVCSSRDFTGQPISPCLAQCFCANAFRSAMKKRQYHPAHGCNP